jgi:5-methylcytosine-specific restriction endonuclease McrA
MSANHTAAVKAEMARLKPLVLERDGHQCVVCGGEEELQLDHIIPLDSGGANELDNMQILCRPCNRDKSNKILRRQPFIHPERQVD